MTEDALQVAAGTPGNQRFGALLKALRERSGLTPQALADQAKVHVSFVRGIERGAQAPSMASARPLLACLTEQDRIRWVEDGPHDLLIRDPDTDRDVAFEFTAKVKGQNRRPEPVAVAKGLVIPAAALLGLAAAFPWKNSKVDTALTVLGEAAEQFGKHQIQLPSPADEARFGRVVRLLAAADDELLGRVESLLLKELDPDS
ncbi:hypothetical protein Q0Z83_042590 [Actinoplanes sichuanensis]|uniref:Helix-turn-helix domain-containing protein n=1 Tax=Actinoplanes sichuanensis TaxID=512349 RepID=A0ABW4AVC6_9ACTN|nr:helix-turn-helix transcriptional regulator [Actinoplanes sichuanensis]BEL06068.1 hypothetical protein Q0Z83_042590 [Actinoplanes sichuanensis]